MTSVLLLQHDVLWLQISVDNLVSVQVLDCEQHLSGVEESVLRDQLLSFPDLTEQGAPRNVLEFEVEVVLVLESAVHTHDERAELAASELE